MSIKKYWYLLFLVACMESEKLNSPKLYFDLPQLIHSQVALLSAESPIFLKKADFGGKSSEKKTNQIDWEQELKTFEVCDINLPVLKDSYQVIDTDTARIYENKDAKASVRRLIVKGNSQKPEAVYCHWVSENPFYKTEKHLVMVLEGEKLQSYEMRGYQKLIFRDSLHFRIEGIRQ